MCFIITLGIQPADSTSGGADPHFVCPLKNNQNFCFSVQGIPDFIFTLFSGQKILLNAKFSLPKIEESHLILNSSTFIEQMGLTVKQSVTNKLTKAKISALDHSILIGDDLVIVKDHPITIKILNSSVTTVIEDTSVNHDHDETAWVKIITNIGFSLKFKFVKKHLDYVITDITGLTTETHGIQGSYKVD